MLPEIKIPEFIKFPDQFSIQIIPGELVLIGNEVHITITYENGSYENHHPSLELTTHAGDYSEIPITITTLIKPKHKTVDFIFVPKDIGIYSFRLKPFTNIDIGELVEIHALNEEEDSLLQSFFTQLFSEPTDS